MAAFATFIHCLLVDSMAEIYWLLFLTIKEWRKHHPAGDEMRHKTHSKRHDGNEESPRPWFFWFMNPFGRDLCFVLAFSHYFLFFFCCAHGNSKLLGFEDLKLTVTANKNHAGSANR
jgi:hypothetical protein